MVAYSFQKQFAEPILSGQKLQTIRAPRKRHARPGETLQLFTGMRTRHCKKIAEKKCVAVLPVVIMFDLFNGRVFVHKDYPFKTEDNLWRMDCQIIEENHYYLQANKEDFARRDGFESWDHMAAFWAQHHGMGKPNDYFVGVLIGWWPE